MFPDKNAWGRLGEEQYLNIPKWIKIIIQLKLLWVESYLHLKLIRWLSTQTIDSEVESMNIARVLTGQNLELIVLFDEENTLFKDDIL